MWRVKLTEQWLEESTIEQEGNEEAERKRWSQQCHAGRKALPWHFANRREGCWWWRGYTAEERRGEKGPEGYRCWRAPALDTVKERKQEIWGEVNLSLTLWPTTMCYPQQEASQTERERGGQAEGRKLSNFILSEEREKNEQQKWKKMHSSCVYNQAVSGEDTKSPQSSLYQRDDKSAFDSVSYYHTVGSVFLMQQQLIQFDSILFSWQSSLYFPQSYILPHRCTQ